MIAGIKYYDIMLGMVFVKGHIGYNKGKKLSGEWRPCLFED